MSKQKNICLFIQQLAHEIDKNNLHPDIFYTFFKSFCNSNSLVLFFHSTLHIATPCKFKLSADHILCSR